MPAKTNVQDILDRLAWVRNLPDSGGAWGQGILGTAESVSSEVTELEQQRAVIVEKIKDRTSLLRTLPGRADREVLLMFSNEAVQAAKPFEPGD